MHGPETGIIPLRDKIASNPLLSVLDLKEVTNLFIMQIKETPRAQKTFAKSAFFFSAVLRFTPKTSKSLSV